MAKSAKTGSEQFTAISLVTTEASLGLPVSLSLGQEGVYDKLFAEFIPEPDEGATSPTLSVKRSETADCHSQSPQKQLFEIFPMSIYRREYTVLGWDVCSGKNQVLLIACDPKNVKNCRLRISAIPALLWLTADEASFIKTAIETEPQPFIDLAGKTPPLVFKPRQGTGPEFDTESGQKNVRSEDFGTFEKFLLDITDFEKKFGSFINNLKTEMTLQQVAEVREAIKRRAAVTKLTKENSTAWEIFLKRRKAQAQQEMQETEAAAQRDGRKEDKE